MMLKPINSNILRAFWAWWFKEFIRLAVKIILPCMLWASMSACSSVSYYAHIMNGHHALTVAEEDIEDILAENKYDEALRSRLKKALEIRKYASEQLGLPDNDSYKSFVKLDRPYPIWNVIAAQKFSVKPKQWCFLIVGCINYRGYFSEQDANTKAKELAAEGYDVAVSPAAAYSTLGWFDDPLLSSMLYKEDSHLAGIIFHELAHQQVYIDDDSSFNEAFATTVEIEGVRRWLALNNDQRATQAYRRYKQRQKQFNQLLKTTQQQLKALYQQKRPDEAMLQQKQMIIAGMKQGYRQLKRQWGGYTGYDKWMSRDINNAHLALVATYHELVPAFEHLLLSSGTSLPDFYTAVATLGDLPREKRAAELKKLALRSAFVSF